jgi:hypothetical protein
MIAKTTGMKLSILGSGVAANGATVQSNTSKKMAAASAHRRSAKVGGLVAKETAVSSNDSGSAKANLLPR